MDILNTSDKLLLTLEYVFSKECKPIRKNLALSILSLIKSETCSLSEVAIKMETINNKSFNTNEKRITRFLQSSNFQVNDKLWRQYLKFVFKLLNERDFSFKNRKIAINVDFTTKTDEFNILSASLPFEGRGIPLYFSMRNYPKYKGMFDQKKMEKAFIKELKHLLPKHYQYVIVADRGFGNGRFADLCETNGFSYILRTKDNLKILQDEFADVRKLKDFSQSKFDFPYAKIVTWDKQVRLIKASEKSSKWHIVTDILKSEFLETVLQYGCRFKCEKMFQDEKSSGFDIENSKIRKYERFKRLLFCVNVAQMLMMFIGDYINDNVDELKKRFYFHLNLISAFSL